MLSMKGVANMHLRLSLLACVTMLMVAGPLSAQQRLNPEWQLQDCRPCSEPCGGGTQTCVVRCIDANTGNIISDDFCANFRKPLAERSCNTEPCGDVEWQPVKCGPCSVDCGGGVQQCAYVCVDAASGAEVDPAICEKTIGPPPAEQECNTDPCVEELFCCEQADGSGVCLPESQCPTPPIGSCPAGVDEGVICQDPPKPVCCTTKDANGQVVSLCVLDRDCDGSIEGDCPAGVAGGSMRLT